MNKKKIIIIVAVALLLIYLIRKMRIAGGYIPAVAPAPNNTVGYGLSVLPEMNIVKSIVKQTPSLAMS